MITGSHDHMITGSHCTVKCFRVKELNVDGTFQCQILQTVADLVTVTLTGMCIWLLKEVPFMI